VEAPDLLPFLEGDTEIPSHVRRRSSLASAGSGMIGFLFLESARAILVARLFALLRDPRSILVGEW